MILVCGYFSSSLTGLRPSGPDPFGCREHSVPDLTAPAAPTALLQPKFDPNVTATKARLTLAHTRVDNETGWDNASRFPLEDWFKNHSMCVCVCVFGGGTTDLPTHHHGNNLAGQHINCSLQCSKPSLIYLLLE